MTFPAGRTPLDSSNMPREEIGIARPLREPLMVHRSYVRNIVDLLLDTVKRAYGARNRPTDITIAPGSTVGGAFGVNEQAICSAFAATTNGTSAIVGYINTLIDRSVAPGAQSIVKALVPAVLTNSASPTFAAKADQLEDLLALRVTNGDITQAQADQIVGTVRDFGDFVTRLLAAEFPRIEISAPYMTDSDKDVTKWIEFSSGYSVTLSADPDDVIDVRFSDAGIELTLDMKQFVLSSFATLTAFKEKKGRTREKLELLTNLANNTVGAITLNGIRLTLTLAPEIGPRELLPQLPGHTLRRADYVDSSIEASVDSVVVGLGSTVLTTIGNFFAGVLGLGSASRAISDGIMFAINDSNQLGALNSAVSGYVVPQALKLLPGLSGLPSTRYRGIWSRVGNHEFQEFARLEPAIGTHFVGLRNRPKVDDSLPPGDPDNFRPTDPDTDGNDPARRTARPSSSRVARAGATATGVAAVSPAVVGPNAPIDDGVWDSEYGDQSPVDRQLGDATDPCWAAMSCNCVIPTALFRALNNNGMVAGTGTFRQGRHEELAYEIAGCTNIAADFTGIGTRGAPAIAFRSLVVSIGPDANGVVRAFAADGRVKLRATLPGDGCLPDAAVSAVAQNLECLETMSGGVFEPNVRSKQIEHRYFVYLSPDLAFDESDPAALDPIQLLRVVSATGASVSDDDRTLVRTALSTWLPSLPEAPIMYNTLVTTGAQVRSVSVRDGWIEIRCERSFPNFG